MLREAAWRGGKIKITFLENDIFLTFQGKILIFFIKYMKKFSQFYVTYQKIVQFECRLWMLLGFF